MNKTQEHPNLLQNFEVRVDGELSTDYVEPAPTLAETVAGHIGALAEKASQQVSMAVYDTIHRTNYRSIRNSLMAEKRNREQEKRLGLERV